jgi:hypothetical protein
MVRNQMGKHNRSVMVAVYGTPCAIPSRKQQITVTATRGWMKLHNWKLQNLCCVHTLHDSIFGVIKIQGV